MYQKTFQALLKYYLSCMDAEEATHLQLRKNQQNKSHIFLRADEEQLFSKNMPKLEIAIPDERQKGFIRKRAPDTETLINLHYGFPVFIDDKDMLSPLFFIEVKAEFSNKNTLLLFPQSKGFSINHMHLSKRYGPEETQAICEELEGKFGSFEARMKSAKQYIASLNDETEKWIKQPILFRTNFSNSRPGLRYDLTFLLKNDDAHNKDTALKYFLQTEKEAEQTNPSLKTRPLILETDLLNRQQEDAVLKGLTEPFSVITGPPGTGKTQTVTALLASAVYKNETVLFSSNNNMPVDGVYKRLGKNTGKAGNWIIRLGNKEKRETCHKMMASLLKRLEAEKFSPIPLDEEKEEFRELEHHIEEARTSLKKAHILQQEISDLHQEEKKIEQNLSENWLGQFTNVDPEFLNKPLLKKLTRHSHPNLWLWLRCKLFGTENFIEKHNLLLRKLCETNPRLSEYQSHLLFDEAQDEAISKSRQTATDLHHHQKWTFHINQRRHKEEKMRQCASMSDISNLKYQKEKISQKLFGAWWINNIHDQAKDATIAFGNYFRDIEDFSPGRHKRLEKSLRALKDFFPAWTTTNQSTSAIMPPEPALFDLLIIDEAGQCDIASVIPLLYRAKRAVIIGDPYQFKHITSLKNDAENAIAQETGLEEIIHEWSFKHRSAFDRSFAATKNSSFLKQHYRCHPDIIEFSNLNFYGGALVEPVALSQFEKKFPLKETGLIWHNVTGQAIKAEKGAWNQAEIEKTIDIFSRWEKEGRLSDPNMTYGVVTPFRKQVNEMRKALSKFSWFKSIESRFTIGTVHSFQGSECNILIYSPVVSEGLKSHLVQFAASQEDLINVTVTRAKNLLYIIGDLHACLSISSHTPLHKLATYAEHIRKRQQYPENIAEKKMAKILDELNLSYTPQYVIEKYRLDFILNAPSGERYNIEVDGDIHLTPEAIQHDEIRDAYIKSKGLAILRFAARDVLHRPELIKERLKRV